MAPQSLLSSSLTVCLYAICATSILSISVLLFTYVYTNIRYRIQMQAYRSNDQKGRLKPAQVPYTLPFLGHALFFLSKQPGQFWTQLMQWHSRATGACTLVLGGRNLYVLFDPHATEALMKAKEPNRDKLTAELLSKTFGLDDLEVQRFCGFGEPIDSNIGRTPRAEQERINQEYLLKTDRVNELTASFIRALKKHVPKTVPNATEQVDLDLYMWIRKHMFIATVTALFGETMLEDCPQLEQDFFDFDQDFLTCFFGVPRWIAPRPYEAREDLHATLIHHQELNEKRTKSQSLDPDGDVIWDPVQGSRWVRARQIYYRKRGLSVREMGINDLALMFGVASNAIPAVGWMLLHILDPNGDKTLLPRVQEQIRASQKSDGNLDMSLLVNQPLLLSIFHEVLRLYVDVLVARDLPVDQTLPIGAKGKQVTLGKGGLVMVPSWLAHRDDTRWVDAEKFDAERWLSIDPETGKQVFSTRGSTGKFFPFGGGKGYCPGRIFSKQEILAFVAIVLIEFHMRGLGYVDKHGATTDSFPQLAKVYPGPAMMVMEGDMKVRIQKHA